MEYCGDTWCIGYTELLAVMPAGTLNWYATEKKIEKIQRGCKGKEALFSVGSLPERYRVLVERVFGKQDSTARIKGLWVKDIEAVEWFSKKGLKIDKQKEYVQNASMLKAISRRFNEMKADRKSRGGSVAGCWQAVCQEAELCRNAKGYEHTLPKCDRAMKRKLDAFIKEGYDALITRKMGNQNSRKVTKKIERLILSLYCRAERPFAKSVSDDYIDYMMGRFDLVDVESGEIFSRMDFVDSTGAMVQISESTVRHYVDMPRNRVIVAKRREDAAMFRRLYEPHTMRVAPYYSFSKISMDDRDLPRKDEKGKQPKAYYAYDVASGCVVGASYSRDKDINLVYECFKDMYRRIDKWGLGFPLEVEVEHHLMNKIADKLGQMFPIVTFCSAGNSQQKRAEHFNRAKKYSVEKRNHTDIGRWWAKSETCRVRVEREGAEWKEKRYHYDRLIMEDLQDVQQYNAQLHPNQDAYSGMSRLDVLIKNQNPKATKNISREMIVKMIGYQSKNLTLWRSQYVKVQGCEYSLSSPEMMEKLVSDKVDAYWLRDDNGEIGQVYLWQGDKFIDCCKKIERFNEAKAEMTQKDYEALGEQMRYINSFREHVKQELEKKVVRLKAIDSRVIKEAEKEVEIAPEIEKVNIEKKRENKDFAAMAAQML